MQRRGRVFGPSALAPTALAIVALSTAACRGPAPVVRVLSGELVQGPYISSDAYASFLMGALAEEDGKLALAARFYRETARRDPGSAEAHARLALVRCKAGDLAEGRAAAARASENEPSSATAARALAACATAERQAAPATEALAVAAQYEPGEAELQRELAMREAAAGDVERARARLEAWVLIHASSPELRMSAAEVALRAGRSMRAVELALSATTLSSALAPRAAQVALGLAAQGAGPEARRLAGALVELGPIGHRGQGRVATTLREAPLVFRLAIDEALLADDVAKAEASAVKGGVSLGEVAGRALLWGKTAVVRAILPTLEEASPADAAVVRLALGDKATLRDVDDVTPTLVVALLLRAERTLDSRAASAVAAAMPAIKVDPRDALLSRAVESARR